MDEKMYKPVMAILIAFGEILIISGFYILVPADLRGNIFFLNIVVVSIVYLVNVFSFLDFFPTVSEIDRSVAGLGIKWFFILAYSILALTILTIGLVTILSFKYQLVLQLFTLFILLVGLVISARSSDKSQKLADQQGEERNRKQQINDILLRLSLDIKRKVPDNEQELNLIEKLKEKNRMLTVSNHLTAQELENEIINELSNLNGIILTNDSTNNKILEVLNRCQILFDQRKQFYTN